MKPKLKLVIDVGADINNAKYFIAHGRHVEWFLPEDFRYIINKKISSSERNKIIEEYTKDTHKTKKKDILEGVGSTRKQWAGIESKYYNFVAKLFKGHDWPKGNYMGFASIFLMFPRNIQKKFFYFPYPKSRLNAINTIAHEMLHFIFFDYIEKRYGIKERGKFKNKDPRYIWKVSEAFNTVIENSRPYMKIFNSHEFARPYSECEKIYKTMSKQWAKDPDIENFLDKWLLAKNF